MKGASFEGHWIDNIPPKLLYNSSIIWSNLVCSVDRECLSCAIHSQGWYLITNLYCGHLPKKFFQILIRSLFQLKHNMDTCNTRKALVCAQWDYTGGRLDGSPQRSWIIDVDNLAFRIRNYSKMPNKIPATTPLIGIDIMSSMCETPASFGFEHRKPDLRAW